MWITIEDKLPPENTKILVYKENWPSGIHIARYGKVMDEYCIIIENPFDKDFGLFPIGNFPYWILLPNEPEYIHSTYTCD